MPEVENKPIERLTCPRCLRASRQIIDPGDRTRRICAECGLAFSPAQARLAEEGKLKIEQERYRQ
jgi:hypothetical protein